MFRQISILPLRKGAFLALFFGNNNENKSSTTGKRYFMFLAEIANFVKLAVQKRLSLSKRQNRVKNNDSKSAFLSLICWKAAAQLWTV